MVMAAVEMKSDGLGYATTGGHWRKPMAPLVIGVKREMQGNN